MINADARAGALSCICRLCGRALCSLALLFALCLPAPAATPLPMASTTDKAGRAAGQGVPKGAAGSWRNQESAADRFLPLPPHPATGPDERPDERTGERPDERAEEPARPKGPRELALQQRGIVGAELRPAHPALIVSPFAAALASINVRDGEAVEQGQVLAVLDARFFAREMEEARQGMERAVERVQNAQSAGDREKEAARENLARAADQLQEAEERLARTSLIAPFAGRVIEITAKTGQMLRRGENILEIARPDDLEVVSTIPSAWVSRLRPGHLIWVFIEETGRSYEARFERFGGKVNVATRTIRAYATLRAPAAELLPGMSGRADFFPRTGK